MASKSYKNSKKVDEVKEVCMNKSEADIVKILDIFDNDVAKTINAFMTDNGKEALSKWTSQKRQEKKQPTSIKQTATEETTNGTDPAKSTKHKPNKKTTKANNKTENSTAHTGGHINDLVSSIINQSITTTVPSAIDTDKKHIATTDSLSSQVQQQQSLLDNLNNLIISGQTANLAKSIGGLKVTILGTESTKQADNNQSSLTSSPSSMSAASVGSSTFENKQAPQYNNQQTTKQKTPLDTEFYKNPLNTHLNMAYTNPNNIHGSVLDKSQKDLHRQATQLAKISTQFQDDLNKAQLNCNQTFILLHNLLDQRQQQLQTQLNTTARIGTQQLAQRQYKAARLRNLVDNAVHLNDQDTLELKADIKHFVSERQLDEEFTKLKLFQQDNSDRLHETIASFGKIPQINVKYATERPPIEEILNSSFSSPKISPQPNGSTAGNKKTQSINGGGQKTAGAAKSANTNGVRHSVKITEVNGFSGDEDTLEDEGEFIEVKKPQRNKVKNQHVNVKTTSVTITDNENTIPKKTPQQNGLSTTHNTNGTSNGGPKLQNANHTGQTNGTATNGPTNGSTNATGVNKKKKKAKKAAEVPISKANINPFSIIANGHIN